MDRKLSKKGAAHAGNVSLRHAAESRVQTTRVKSNRGENQRNTDDNDDDDEDEDEDEDEE
ncbi:hypothetical protein K0M31_005370 [Melipona bicolor]|uniref:Uncharacterized protein n=1 Tax=Melipona bicolor TaxID=60889 RepID=A0AA40FVM8_9HYME|nr:hypothetical protein K0M31_005370 [Melipona bicolor]